MRYKQEKGERRSIRLTNYDYAQAGAYFVTICTFQRHCLMGEILMGAMDLSKIGQIVNEEWLRSPEIRTGVKLDIFQIMPNHIHGIVIFAQPAPDDNCVGAHSRAPLSRQPRSLGSLVAGFKSASTKRINQLRGTPGLPVWQRNYYERVIRDDRDLDAIRHYIVENPAKWAEDSENPRNSRR